MLPPFGVIKLDIKKLKNPPKEFRTSPFWAWNDDLTSEELRWQVQEMKKQGFGGFFMHAREGLRTHYLSENWFDLVKATVAEAETQDMEAWLYDEDRWPSGCAGGIVTANRDEFKAKAIAMVEIVKSEVEQLLLDPNLVAIFRLSFETDNLVDSQRITSMAELDSFDDASEKYKILYFAFSVEIQRPTNNSNGNGYIDVLNPEAVREFIRVTHEQYQREVGEHFGTVIPGVFADEPTYRSKAGDTLPWSLEFPRYFLEYHDYDLVDQLPFLFFSNERAYKVRYDYFYTLTKKFVAHFTKQIYLWCDKNGIQFTGHLLSEDTMTKQTNAVGSAMAHYQYMHLPGIDHLGNHVNNALTLKQCASVGNQLNRKRMLCEIFGVSGHHMTFQDQKWIADYHFALGIPFLSQHLLLYSMTGDRKRDYPPTFSYQQPYWPYYHQINDYMARAGYFCSQGDYLAETLVLHPLGSVWATFNREAGRALSSSFDSDLVELQESLFAAQVPFDYGDELIMEEHAKVIKDSDQVYLQVGACRYSTVIVPPSLTWSQFTYDLIAEFIQQGGKLLFSATMPTMIAGESAKDAWKLLTQGKHVSILPETKAELIESLKICYRPLEIELDSQEYSDEILYQMRQDDDNFYIFITNTSREATRKLTVRTQIDGSAWQVDFFRGELQKVFTRRVDRDLVFNLELAPAGSCGYLIKADSKASSSSELSVKPTVVESFQLSNDWSFERIHPNSLTLDYCRYALDDGQWSDELPVWQVRRILWKKAGFDRFNSLQPWAIMQELDGAFEPIPLRLKFNFAVTETSDWLALVIENSQNWRLKVNEIEISTETSEYHWDKKFGKIDISKVVKLGENSIELTTDYCYGIDIEDIYLIGNFALSQKGYKTYSLVSEPLELQSGSWVYQGYPFYAGNMVYKAEFSLSTLAERRIVLRLENPKGTLFNVAVNGQKTEAIITEPWEIDITESCVEGKNKLAIEVVGSLRNTFGPLHHRALSPGWCGPGQFVDRNNWIDSYQFEDYGLLDGAKILIKK